MESKYTNAQFVALNAFLAYWPEGMPYAEIIEELHTEDETSTIDACGDFEDLSPSHLAQLIVSLHDQLVKTYGAI
jgi:hypothetical protein